MSYTSDTDERRHISVDWRRRGQNSPGAALWIINLSKFPLEFKGGNGGARA